VAGSGDLAGVTLRKLSANDVAADKGGWYIDLVTKDSDGKVTDAGERVVVTPAALFDTNTAIIQTLIPSATDPCDPMLLGSVMLIDANSGGPGSGVSAVGGYPYVGARVNNVRTSGTIPVTTTVGGGKALLPGLTLTGSKKNPDTPFSGDAPIWRRRSWSVINNVH
jgi:type IV pilus assembly protein PilY1